MSSNEWQKYKLHELCQSISITRKFDKEQLIFLNTGDIENGRILHRNYSNVRKMPGQAKKTIRKDDILFSEIRPANGRYALIDFNADDYVVSTKLMVIRANRKILPKYLYLFLTSKPTTTWLQHQAESRSGTFPQITFDHIAELDIQIPQLPEQKLITDFCSSLDDKIELNRQVNATLESQAWAVFRHWFVENGGNDYEEKSLDEIANYLNGLALQKYPAEEGKDYLPVIKIAQLRKNDTSDADKANTNIPDNYIIKDGDVLFSWSGSLEVVVWCGGKGALNQHLFKVTSENYPKWFYYFWTKHHLPEFQAIAADKATTMGHIQRHHLHEAKVLVPSKAELHEMDKVMSPILEMVISNEKESRTLAELRDTLLPKLMRGEVRVKA